MVAELQDASAAGDAATQFALRFARVGHAAGYPTADLEERVLALSRALGIDRVQISATPTLVELSVGRLSQQRTYTLRVVPSAVDLALVARLDDLVRDVLDGRTDAATADATLRALVASPRRIPQPLLLAGYALAAAALTPILGGSWREALAGALVGVAAGTIALRAGSGARTEAIVAPLAALTAAFCAAALVWAGLDVSVDDVTLAALLTFLPGMTLTIGMRELATQHLQSGVANTANALAQLLGLVVGVEVGRATAAAVFGAPRTVAGAATLTGPHLLAAAVVGLAFTVTLRARARDAGIMAAAAVLAIAANEAGRHLLGAQAGVFAAALAVGVAGNTVGALSRRSPLVFIVPGVLMLVPGSAGFSSALQLLANQTVSGLTTAFDMFVTAILIAYGLMVSTVVLPRRFARFA